MSILAIGAHPDDIEIGCGGSLSKFAQAGQDIHMMVMTLGGMGGEREQRKEEQIRSKNILGEFAQASSAADFDVVRVCAYG